MSFKPKFKSVTEMLAAGANEKAFREERQNIWTVASMMMRTADEEGRELTASEKREYDAYEKLLDEYGAAMELTKIDRSNVPVGMACYDGTKPGTPLTEGRSMAQYIEGRGLVNSDERDLRVGAYFRGMLTGNWHGAEAERRAMVAGTATAGGHLIPAPLSAKIIDRARNSTRVMQAGATIVPMESATLKLARLVGDPSMAWHTEMALIAASDAQFDAVTLTARSLAARVIISRELIEDADGVDEAIINAFAQQLAATVDGAALYGTGTAPEPRGVKNVAEVTKTPLAANGAAPSYDALIDSAYRVRTANHEPNAFIYAPRTGSSLAKLKDSTGQYLRPPVALDEITRYETGQVPVNLTVGTSTDTSDVFTGDWSELLIGIRTQLEVSILKERSADVGAFELLAWWRGDVAVARPGAFDVITGVRP